MNLKLKNFVKKATKNNNLIDLILKNTSSYVRSWRWLPLSKNIIENLIKENRIFIVEQNNEITAISIVRDSDHFEKTILITLISGNEISLKELLNYFQNYAKETNCERIQVLSKLKNIPKIEDFEKKITFCLLKKQI